MTTYTKEEKQKYFAGLRDKWASNKLASEQDEDAKAKWQAINEESGQGVSYMGFYFTYAQMREQGLAGLPYVNAKTFNMWRKAGYKVKKGEKSTLTGISWVEVGGKSKEGEDVDGFLMPKEYHLFHDSQIEAI